MRETTFTKGPNGWSTRENDQALVEIMTGRSMTEDEQAKFRVEWDKSNQRQGDQNMPYKQRVGSTNLFSNRDKKTEKQPDFKGSIEVQVGEVIVELDVAMWQKHSDKAGDYFYTVAKARGSRAVDDVERAMPREDDEIRF